MHTCIRSFLRVHVSGSTGSIYNSYSFGTLHDGQVYSCRTNAAVKNGWKEIDPSLYSDKYGIQFLYKSIAVDVQFASLQRQYIDEKQSHGVIRIR